MLTKNKKQKKGIELKTFEITTFGKARERIFKNFIEYKPEALFSLRRTFKSGFREFVKQKLEREGERKRTKETVNLKVIPNGLLRNKKFR